MVDINEYEKIVKKYREQLFKYCYYRLMQNKTLAQETLNDVIYVGSIINVGVAQQKVNKK